MPPNGKPELDSFGDRRLQQLITAVRVFGRAAETNTALGFDTVPDPIVRLAATRVLSFIGAAAMILFMVPVLTLIVICVKISSRGPVLVRERRVGQGGLPFDQLRFRTFAYPKENLLRQPEVVDAVSAPAFVRRPTRIGRLLSALSLDELPAMWNILRGEMRLVGPPSSQLRTIEPLAGVDPAMFPKPGITENWSSLWVRIRSWRIWASIIRSIRRRFSR